jgi:hypothetical protein
MDRAAHPVRLPQCHPWRANVRAQHHGVPVGDGLLPSQSRGQPQGRGGGRSTNKHCSVVNLLFAVSLFMAVGGPLVQLRGGIECRGVEAKGGFGCCSM